MNIKKGDTVKIRGGKDRGKTGTVLRAFPNEEKIMISGLNLFKKRSRPKKQGEKGEMVEVPRPLPRSRVMFICPSCKQAVRLGVRKEGTEKVRVCKKCEAVV